jgi:hypothetical protein
MRRVVLRLCKIEVQTQSDILVTKSQISCAFALVHDKHEFYQFVDILPN